MKHGSTMFARAVVFVVGIAAVSVLTILLPELAREESVGKETNSLVTVLFLAAAYIIATPFFVALYQSLKLIKNIDEDKAFSNGSIKILQNIKRCSIVFGVLIVAAAIGTISFARSVDPTEEVTFIVTFACIFTFVSSVMAIFIAVLEKLLADAVALKSENDLIV